MTVCKFFAKGQCKFGNNCKFEHPGSSSQGNQSYNQNNRSNQNQNSNSSSNRNQRQPQNDSNRYGALGNHQVTSGNGSYNQNQNYNSNQRYSSGKAPPGPSSTRDNRTPRNRPYALSAKHMEEYLYYERPSWVLSSFGPGVDAPIQLFGGYPLEQSMEELRVQHYLAMAMGNGVEQSAQLEAELAAQANSQVQNALSNLDAAMDYIVEGAKNHPNRIDETINQPSIRRGGYGPFSVDRPNKPRYQPPAQSSSFQNTSIPTFANQTSSSFGTQPAAVQNNQPMGFAQNQASSGFGVAQPQQPNSFGQPMQNSFGQLNQVPNAFGQPQQDPAPFGQPQNNTMNGFGGLQQPPQQQNNGFGGLQQPPQQQSNAFGQPQAPFGMAVAAQPIPQPIQGFGQSQQVQQGGFGQPGPASNSNGFGGQFQQQQQQQQQAPETFSQQTNGGFSSFSNQNPAQQPSNGFGSQVSNGPSSQTLQNTQQQSNNNSATNAADGLTHPDIASYTTRDNSGRLLTWKGARVNYIDNQPCYQTPDGSMERIWFPDGPPTAQSWEPSTENFTTEMMQAYEFLRQNGAFQGGVMPEQAPRIDMVPFNL